jgi:hypothetical protein
VTEARLEMGEVGRSDDPAHDPVPRIEEERRREADQPDALGERPLQVEDAWVPPPVAGVEGACAALRVAAVEAEQRARMLSLEAREVTGRGFKMRVRRVSAQRLRCPPW